ncbi:MAG: ATP-binding protein [Candidatus Eisenbacteria bacterium]|uniref:ATP-binding protein n=1 Tax=Eiseniibacteriota bacterium TaxID=2212470 RepID=A0A956LZT3_UNCEI|nr:ATP-binding protein [Candidatus Eisenbacteria bacterium]
MLPRIAQSQILSVLTTGKVVVLYGPRQVGKTTLLHWLAGRMGGRGEILNGDFLDDRVLLKPERARLADLVEGLDYLFVDEAQLFPDVGRCLKAIHDHYPDVKLLATGSSALDLSQHTGEPLTGRQIRVMLYPLAYAELDPRASRRSTILEQAMLYGTYPEVWSLPHRDDKIAHLRQLVSDYVLKDVFALVDLNRSKLTDVLRLLALQIGSEVSLSEIGRQVQMDTKTIARYLDLLESAFVIIRLGGYSRNLRKEVAKSRKIYFIDLGLRNALIQAFQPLDQRDDVGSLWENLMVVERIKRHAYSGSRAQHYFWRTYDQKELDLIEEEDGALRAYEFKYGRRRAKIPPLWSATYPDSTVEVIDAENAHRFLNMEWTPEESPG